MITSLRDLFARLRQRGTRPAAGGFVTLVGAGPGAAELLTIGGLRALTEADYVLHDRLVGAEVLALVPPRVVLEDVGKLTGQDHDQTQARIAARLLALARAGKRVVRLKGGDPFVFGRGGEELEVLAAHGVPYAVIPGITAALGCAAYAGIPLTHRDHARQLSLVTAHCRQSMDQVDWRSLGNAGHTVVFYMGVAQLPLIEARLLDAGRAAQTPVALIERGSTDRQRVVLARLDQLAEAGRAHVITAPALVVVGEVAALGEPLAWFGTPVCHSAGLDDRRAA